jgi:anaerobic magnesium-protoporphyrin IX monomethyl ester cyclase
MDVLLVGGELEENLALRYLGAALREAGHVPHYARFDHAGDAAAVREVAARVKPGIVGLSMTFQFRAKEFGALAGLLKDAGYRGHVTGGGHFPTFAFEACLAAFPGLDSVVRHEGEQTIVELASALEKGGGRTALGAIRGLAFRDDDGAVVVNEPRPLATDLDALPFPERFGEPQLHLGIPAAFLVGSRGCFGHCTFCCIHAYLKSAGGPKYRMRSPANVADEMMELRRKRGVRMFVFHDDDFFTRDAEHDLVRVTALRDELRRRAVDDVAVVVKARPDDVEDRVFRVLREIGLLRVYLGIEAGSTQGLRTLGRGVDMTANRRALFYLRARDVYTCFNMLVFDPESRLESLEESFRFLREIPDVPMNFCRTEIYVGTPLMTKLSREGRLVGDVFGWDYAIRDPRAERAFRVFARAFLDRNFRCDGLMNSTLGVGYHLHLLSTFYPGAATPALRELARATTARVNLDCIERMEKILAFAKSPASEDRAAFEDFAARTTEEVNAANGPLEAMVHETTAEIVRAAIAPRRARKPAPSGVSRWQAVGAAALALGPAGACERAINPPPPDPPPPPIADGGAVPTAAPSAHPTVTATLTPPDPLPPPTVMPPDPLPPPTVMPSDPSPLRIDAGSRFAKPPPTATTGKKPPPPPPDPLPPPTLRHPPPPDPLPRPYTK